MVVQRVRPFGQTPLLTMLWLLIAQICEVILLVFTRGGFPRQRSKLVAWALHAPDCCPAFETIEPGHVLAVLREKGTPETTCMFYLDVSVGVE